MITELMEDWASDLKPPENLDQLESNIVNSLHTAANQAIPHQPLLVVATTSSLNSVERLKEASFTRNHSCRETNLEGNLRNQEHG